MRRSHSLSASNNRRAAAGPAFSRQNRFSRRFAQRDATAGTHAHARGDGHHGRLLPVRRGRARRSTLLDLCSETRLCDFSLTTRSQSQHPRCRRVLPGAQEDGAGSRDASAVGGELARCTQAGRHGYTLAGRADGRSPSRTRTDRRGAGPRTVRVLRFVAYKAFVRAPTDRVGCRGHVRARRRNRLGDRRGGVRARPDTPRAARAVGRRRSRSGPTTSASYNLVSLVASLKAPVRGRSCAIAAFIHTARRAARTERASALPPDREVRRGVILARNEESRMRVWHGNGDRLPTDVRASRHVSSDGAPPCLATLIFSAWPGHKYSD